MDDLFSGASSFNQDIWMEYVKLSVELSRTFMEATARFNQDIGNWDVSNVEIMVNTFNGASSFNHDISSWNSQAT